MTVVEMLEKSSELYSSNTAIYFRDRVITYGDLYRDVRLAAGFLQARGVGRGDRVGVMTRKVPEQITSLLAAMLAGAIPFPVDFGQTKSALAATMDMTRPGSIVVADEFTPLLEDLPSLPSADRIIVIGTGSASGMPSWGEMLDAGLSPSVPALTDDDPCYLNFTSGTTGAPRAACATHGNVYWNTRASVECLGLTHGDVHLCMFPPFAHPHELFARPIYLGGALALVGGISPKVIAGAINACGVTAMMGVATIYAGLVRAQRLHGLELPSLRLAESGGMHFAPALAREFEEAFGIPIVPVWGSTETTGVALASPVGEPYRASSVGKPCPHYSIRIVTESGSDAGVDEVGEMIAQGPGVCASYYGDAGATSARMRDGWFRTGDLMRRDADGYYYFAGRETRMLKVAGLKVYPPEIEDLLRDHPDVAEAAVIGMNSPGRGEQPKAVLVAREGRVIDKGAIWEYCNRSLPNYKVPRAFEIIDELPKTPGGKVLFRVLQERETGRSEGN